MNCNSKGACINGECVCQGDYDGVDCSNLKCANDCNKNGKCNQFTMKCECKDGYKGDYCEEKLCAKPCLNGGKCNDGVCFCEIGWAGKNCESSKFLILNL